jgi:hypothetical protein
VDLLRLHLLDDPIVLPLVHRVRGKPRLAHRLLLAAEVLLGVLHERLELVEHRLHRNLSRPVSLHRVAEVVQEPPLLAVVVVDELERYLGDGF